MAYDNSFLNVCYVLYNNNNINFIIVFTYDKLNYGLKIHIGTYCY